MWLIRIPKKDPLDFHNLFGAIFPDRKCGVLDRSFRWRDLRPDHTILRCLSTFDAKSRSSGVDIRINAKRIYVRGVARFDKNGLPDAAGWRVPAPLLPNRLLVIVHRIFYP